MSYERPKAKAGECRRCRRPMTESDDGFRLCGACRAKHRQQKRDTAHTRAKAVHQVYEPTYPRGIVCALNREWMR